MKRILAFCGRDWRDPKAGYPEYYMHEVLRRLAGQGHYVVWVCHGYRAGPGWGRRPLSLEVVDGIQMARLGARILYRTMAGMFLSRLRERSKAMASFDAILDCVTKRPLDLAGKTDAPIIPVVFGLLPRIRADAQPPGPVIAVSGESRNALLRAGLSERFIVTAPYGAEACSVVRERGERPLLVVTGHHGHRVITKAASLLRREGIDLAVHVLRERRPVFGMRRAAYNPAWVRNDFGPTAHPFEHAEIIRRAWLGYCAPGTELAALQLGAAGIPAVCPATERGREYVEDGVTGLLAGNHSRPTAAELAHAFRRLVTDDVLCKKLIAAGHDRACVQSWDTTADLVLATIENLRTPVEEKPRCRLLEPVG